MFLGHWKLQHFVRTKSAKVRSCYIYHCCSKNGSTRKNNNIFLLWPFDLDFHEPLKHTATYLVLTLFDGVIKPYNCSLIIGRIFHNVKCKHLYCNVNHRCKIGKDQSTNASMSNQDKIESAHWNPISLIWMEAEIQKYITTSTLKRDNSNTLIPDDVSSRLLPKL